LITRKINRTKINSVPLSFILEKININKDVLIDILYKKIFNKKMTIDGYFQSKIICFENGIIFLKNDNYCETNIHLVKNYENNYNIKIKSNMNINNELNNIQKNILEYNKINLNLINEIFNLDIKDLVEILEYSFINNIYIIKEYFYSFFIEYNGYTYHNLCCFDLNDRICSYSISSGNYDIKGKTRKYDFKHKKWVYIDNYTLEEEIKKISKKKLKEYKNKYNIFLFISNIDKCFRLCNRFLEDKYKSKNDNRSVNRGKKLEYYNPSDLIKILLCIIKNTSPIYMLNIKNKFKLNDLKNLNNTQIRNIIKYILFNNEKYIIH
jgi:hypothetical protein